MKEREREREREFIYMSANEDIYIYREREREEKRAYRPTQLLCSLGLFMFLSQSLQCTFSWPCSKNYPLSPFVLSPVDQANAAGQQGPITPHRCRCRCARKESWPFHGPLLAGVHGDDDAIGLHLAGRRALCCSQFSDLGLVWSSYYLKRCVWV